MKGCSKCSQEQGFEKDGIRKNTRKERREHELALELQKEKEKQEEI